MSRQKKLQVSNLILLQSIENISDEMADLLGQVADLRNRRDDLIREGLESGITKVQLSRASDLSIEQIRNVEAFRYSRDSRRPQTRNPGPPRD